MHKFYPQQFAHPANKAIEMSLYWNIKNLQKFFLWEAIAHLTLEKET